MSKVIDMTGQRFGKLVVLRRGENDKHNKAQWWCQCDCGSPEKLISGAALRRGLVVSCGCNKREKLKKYNNTKVVDETGNVYGYLTVLHRVEDVEPKDGRAQWLCRCKCGNEIITTGKLLRDGKKLSCGCLKKSKGEFKVEQLLESMQIIYSEQYTIYIDQKEYETIQRHPYYFDFAVFDSENKNNLLFLIEYDGRQHYTYRKNSDSFLDSKECHEKTKIRDNIKNQWCKDNGIPLIRIPYWHYNDLCIEDLQLKTTNFLI